MKSWQPKLKPLASVYLGELGVENGGFYLHADRLIHRDGEIAFMFSGSDKYGDFNIEGVAMQTKQGDYVTSQIKIVYPEYISNDLATIQFSVIRQTLKKLRCYVEGKWWQHPDAWSFSGNLHKFKV